MQGIQKQVGSGCWRTDPRKRKRTWGHFGRSIDQTRGAVGARGRAAGSCRGGARPATGVGAAGAAGDGRGRGRCRRRAHAGARAGLAGGGVGAAAAGVGAGERSGGWGRELGLGRAGVGPVGF